MGDGVSCLSVLRTVGNTLKGMGLGLLGGCLVVGCIGTLVTAGALSLLPLIFVLLTGLMGMTLIFLGGGFLYQVIYEGALPPSENSDDQSVIKTETPGEPSVMNACLLPDNRATPTPVVAPYLLPPDALEDKPTTPMPN